MTGLGGAGFSEQMLARLQHSSAALQSFGSDATLPARRSGSGCMPVVAAEGQQQQLAAPLAEPSFSLMASGRHASYGAATSAVSPAPLQSLPLPLPLHGPSPGWPQLLSTALDAPAGMGSEVLRHMSQVAQALATAADTLANAQMLGPEPQARASAAAGGVLEAPLRASGASLPSAAASSGSIGAAASPVTASTSYGCSPQPMPQCRAPAPGVTRAEPRLPDQQSGDRASHGSVRGSEREGQQRGHKGGSTTQSHVQPASGAGEWQQARARLRALHSELRVKP